MTALFQSVPAFFDFLGAFVWVGVYATLLLVTFFGALDARRLP